jgi:type IV fimbrial biogenesis protein FimT
MLILRKQVGVTLIELMIGIVIVSLLSVMAAPSFSSWIQNTQVRTAAESILNGMQLARTEAVHRNANIRFSLAANDVSWTVACVTVTTDCPASALYQRSGAEAGGNARAGIALATGNLATVLSAGTGLPAGVTFDGLGRAPAVNGLADIARVDITHAISASARRMVILVSAGGQTRMCDPAFSAASSPQGC